MKENHQKLKKLLFAEQILLLGTLRNVERQYVEYAN